MKNLLFSFIALFFLILPSTSYADEGWTIENFHSDIFVEENGIVSVVEEINVDFNYLSKHGIYRDIPYIYQSDNEKIYTEIDVRSVLQNNQKVKFQTSMADGYIRLKIGDPDETISGKNSYKITYTAKGVLRSFDNHDELYWNVTGNNWPVPIASASALVSLPGDGIIKITCFEGYSGSVGQCASSFDQKNAKFNTSGELSEAQGLTVVVGYQKGMFPILTVERPKSFWEKFLDWPSLSTLGLIVVFGVGTILYLWLKNGRDFWFGNGIFGPPRVEAGKKDDTGTIKPLGAHETTVVEFTPPEKLRPAEVGVLMDERADTHDVVATIIDLASRGFLTITEVPKKWMFGKNDYVLKKVSSQDISKLLNYEKMLLNELFQSGQEVTISSLKKTFYDELKKIKEELYKEVVSKNLFPSDPEKIRGKYYAAAFLLMFFGLFLIGYTVSTGIIFLANLCVGMVVSGFVVLIFARHMPRRTAYGRDIYRRVKGYRLFIDKAETHRQRFFEQKNLFNEVLPYTIVFGLTQKFANQMSEIGLKNANPTWYSGNHPFNTHVFASSMSDFSNSMSSAMASAPSSSGGFSGGSSGGGFGGGGGGSW